MLTSRTTRFALLTVLGAVLAAATITASASAAAQRYAGPTGSGTACSSASPCSITDAVKGAGWGDEVIVAPGDYTLTATLKTPFPITVHGVAGQPRPRLLFSGLGQQGLWVSDSTLRYVEVDQAPGNDWMALYARSNSLVDQVIARGSGYQTAVINNSTIRNSIVVMSGPGGTALETDSNGSNSISTYRNVTAIATAGWAISAWAETDSAKIVARNVIARGGPGVDSLRTVAVKQGTTATITVDHSNWSGKLINGNGSIVDGGDNQSSAPGFVDAAAGDYRQAPGSPTIDAGFGEVFDGPLDVEGDPRRIGTIDIGADEFFVAPTASTGTAGAVTEQSATLSGSVNPNGVPTAYWFEYGPTTAYGSTTLSVDAGSGGAVTATATLGGLSPATTYHYRLVAANSAVVTDGADRTFTTAAPPPPAPSPTPTPTPTPTTQPPTPTPTSTPTPTPTPTSAFAGVNLVSTRLTFGGTFITLRLSCPVATVGRCSGRTKLTARRRASSRRVTLGRTRFSIAPGKQGRVKVRVSRAGRRLLSRVRRLKGKDTNAARDAAGQSKTTAVAVTIRRRQR
jgi:hypothetical protein